MYQVDVEEIAQEQIQTLPEHLLSESASLFSLLELQPWSGFPYNKERPDANMRVHTIGVGGECDVIYLVLDDQRRVVVLRLSWLAP
ncbi:hypothetical protein ACWFMI_17010 [Nocardiopsis terrae]